MVTTMASAIILAGRRASGVDPLAAAHAVSDKCLVPVGGIPMIEHVAKTLSASPWIGKIAVSINDPALLDALPICRALIASGRMEVLKSRGNLADSVIDAVHALEYPVFITTADNVLLTTTAVETMVRTATTQKADAAAAFARKADILQVHTEGQRRFYEFADGGYSNCNCYWIGNRDALQAAEVFRSGGQFAKNPMRIASAFGVVNLIRFRLGLDTLARALERFSEHTGLAIYPVVFKDGALAIDVDNERTYRVVSKILQVRIEQKQAA